MNVMAITNRKTVSVAQVVSFRGRRTTLVEHRIGDAVASVALALPGMLHGNLDDYERIDVEVRVELVRKKKLVPE